LARNDEGEFELVLGNRQLLSVFFIVVILLGVFFTMGYIVGRNSAPGTVDTAAIPKSEPTPSPSEPSTRTAEPAPTAAPAETAAPVETAPQQPVEETRRPEVKKSEPVKEEPSKAEPTRADKQSKTEKKDRAAKRPKESAQPESGQPYLQLAATSRHEAEIMVDVLRKKGFKSLTAEIQEKPGTFRVLVGPIPEGGTNKLRSDLQGAGFPGNAAIRRTF
jgi:hypothetical protein